MRLKTILVTGGAGFIGSNLCKRLREMGNEVISLDNYFAGSIDAHAEGVQYQYIDGHTKHIADLIHEKPDIIYHLGEYARVEASLQEPDVVMDLNIAGTQAVVKYWHSVNESGHRCKFVYAGSSTKFADGGLARNATPYAWTKAVNTELVKNYGEWYGLPYAITYFYNVFGPGERAGKYGTLIEIFRQQYLSGAPLTVISPGTQERNFTHVDDIVDGLILIGKNGVGDEFGLGNERTYRVIDVARLFGGDILMLPPRAGNRIMSELHTDKSVSLGWEAKKSLDDYVAVFLKNNSRVSALDNRVLVFSNNLYPTQGIAEMALIELIKRLPDVQFDIIATIDRDAIGNEINISNAHVHRVGRGRLSDKYLFPFFAKQKALELCAKHKYVFAWSIMASYAGLAAVIAKKKMALPILITLADQDVVSYNMIRRWVAKIILRGTDKVFAKDRNEDKAVSKIVGKALRYSIGDGDAFANQIRFAYNDILNRICK